MIRPSAIEMDHPKTPDERILRIREILNDNHVRAEIRLWFDKDRSEWFAHIRNDTGVFITDGPNATLNLEDRTATLNLLTIRLLNQTVRFFTNWPERRHEPPLPEKPKYCPRCGLEMPKGDGRCPCYTEVPF